MQKAHKHPFHLVDPSPWPLAGSLGALVVALGGIRYMHEGELWLLALGLGIIVLTMVGWWWEVIREAIRDKVHTERVRLGLRIGMGLFIASEVMLFAAFFWAFFFNALGINPGIEVWPPEEVETLPTWGLPFANTLILLSSGATLVWAGRGLDLGRMGQVKSGLAATIVLGTIFLGVQIYEYGQAAFGFAEGVYPSIFYMATGFHGFHVLVGVIFLAVCLIRAQAGQFKAGSHPVGFQASEWYWHFVDAVWVFLFVWVYWWGA